MLKSEKLKTFFESNPREYSLLRHDRALRSKATKHTSLKHVPDYIVPPTLQRIMQVWYTRNNSPPDVAPSRQWL